MDIDMMLDFEDDSDFFEDGLDFESDFNIEGAWDFEDDLDFESDELDIFDPADIVAMEQLGALAADSLEDEEAEDAFIGALASIAAKALPIATKAVPFLIRAGKAVLNKAKRSPAVKSAVRSIPTVMRKTAADQLRNFAAGRPVTAKGTLRSAARHTANVLSNPRRRRRIVRRQTKLTRRRPRYRRICRTVRVG